MSQSEQAVTPLETFIDLLFDWDEENSRLYKSVTWTYKGDDGEKSFANYAAQSRERLGQLIRTRIARNTDVYVALGTQEKVGDKLSVDGFPKAIRKSWNIVSLKSIWLDIDVKGKGYATQREALTALHELLNDTGLPLPTMIVFSGSGGFHVYWCVDRPMTKEEWHVLAWNLRNAGVHHGLKFDASVTIDAARILRVPGSKNYKADTPTDVTMVNALNPIYNYEQLYSILTKYEAFAPRPMPDKKVVLTDKASRFADNIVTIAPTPSIGTVAAVCPTVRDVLARGGDGDPEPLWSQMVYLAAFTDNPERAAVLLSHKDPRYTEAETLLKLEQKTQAKLMNNLGWPSCQSISSCCTTCAACPLLQENRSPLYFAMRHKNVVPPVQVVGTHAGSNPQHTGLAGAPSAQPATIGSLFPGGSGDTGGGGGGEGGGGPTMPPPHLPNPDPIMPPGYWREADNLVRTTRHDAKGNPSICIFFHYPVDDVFIDRLTGELVFLTRIVDNNPRYVPVDASATSSKANIASALGRYGVVIENQTETMRFFVAWIKHIQALRGKKSITASALGWQQGNKSFTYGGFTHAESGPEVAYVKNVDDRFMPKGDLQHWTAAADLIYGNPALEVLVASSFAAPLVGMLGSTSCVLAAHSFESGHGKTTALQVAQAVWGHPITGMSALSDTSNAIMEKVTTLQSLPSYWDELKTEQDNAQVIDIIFSVTGGKGKARLKQDGTPMEVKGFATMFVTASNKRVLNLAMKQTKNTNAGGLRVFEAEVPEMTSTQTRLDAAKRLKALVDNYGRAGEEYVKWITKNRKTVDKIIAAVDKNLQGLDFVQAERFWATTMTTIIAAALITNAMKLTRFDVPTIQQYLVESLRTMRDTLNTGHMSSTNKSNAREILAQMINDIDTTNLITTDYVSSPSRGRSVGQPSKLLRGPTRQIGAVWMQRGQTDGVIRAHRSSFETWLEDKGYDPEKVIRDLRSFYKIVIMKLTIGARVTGWQGANQQQWCFEMIPLPGAQTVDDDELTSSPSPDSSPGSPLP